MCFRVGNTDYKITFLFCAVFALLIAFDNGNLLLSFLAVCAHEGAHLFAMKAYQQPIKSVRLEAFGILIEREKTPAALRQNLVIGMAGCAANLAAFLLFGTGYYWLRDMWLLRAAFINLGLCMLNVLPVQGLDGGQVVLLLARCKTNEEKAVVTAKFISFITCGIVFLFGVILCLKIRFNPSICLLAVFLGFHTFFVQMNME